MGKKLFSIAVFMLFLFPAALKGAAVASGAGSPGNGMLQFSAGGHIFGFAPTRAYLVSLDHALTVEFLGARGVLPKAEEDAPGKGTSSNPPSFHRVVYENLWEGVTLKYSTTKEGIAESTYHLAPGADLSRISLRYNIPVEVQKDGTLRFRFASGDLTESAPVAWQEVDGKRKPDEIAYQVTNNTVGFKVGEHDKTKTLVIDPTYQWHSFYGPNSTAHGIVVDEGGNIYVNGNSRYAWNGPGGEAPLNTFSAGRSNLFLLKLNPAGAYQWHTFYCGVGTGVTLDNGGNILVAAYTDNSWSYIDQDEHIIPPLHPFVTAPSAISWVCWCYFEFPMGTQVCKSCTAYPPNVQVLKLSGAGAYLWHTFYGAGTSTSAAGETLPGDFSFKLGTDSADNIYLSGRSSGSWGGPNGQLPLNAFTPNHINLFAMKLDQSGSYKWHTFYRFVHANLNTAPIAVDPDGNSYIVTSAMEAWTGPSGQSPLHAYDSGALSQAVVLKLDSTGAYNWHTFYGDYFANGYVIAADSGSNIYIAGDGYAFTGPSGQQPVDKGCQNSAESDDNLWIMKLDNNGDYQWHTCYYSGQEIGGITVDNSGNSYITGSSFMGLGSPFDYDSLYEPSTPDGNCDGSAFLLKIGSGGSHLWHAYFGGSLNHYEDDLLTAAIGKGVALDVDGNAHIAGYTFPPWNGPASEAPLRAYSTPWIPSMGDVDIQNSDMFVLKMASSEGCRYFNNGESRLGWFGTGGGTGSFQVEAQHDSTPGACSWTAVSSDNSWLHVTSGDSGAGTGTVAYSVDVNTDQHDRYGTITVGGEYAFPVYQAGVGGAGATVPEVTTVAAATQITDTTASGGGEVVSDGGAVVFRHGVCWSQSANPTKNNACTNDGNGLGAFTSAMSGLTPGSTYHFRAYGSNMMGYGYGEDRQFTTDPPSLYMLTVQAGGNGAGSVSSSVGGVSYSYPPVSSASAAIETNATVTLSATANTGSTVTWYGPCDSTGGSSTASTCTINAMNAAKTVQAAFVTPCAIGPVRSSTTSYFDAIMTGYNIAQDGGSLQIQALSFSENLDLNRNVAMTLQGGYDCGFSTNGGWTTLNSGMIVSAGSVTIDRVIIK